MILSQAEADGFVPKYDEGWWPMESAPRDGFKFLVWMEYGETRVGSVELARFYQDKLEIIGPPNKYKWHPVGWMPCPKHPSYAWIDQNRYRKDGYDKSSKESADDRVFRNLRMMTVRFLRDNKKCTWRQIGLIINKSTERARQLYLSAKRRGLS